MKKLSIVVPLYNERETLGDLHRAVVGVCESKDWPCELIFVDDGSTDGSGEIVDEIARNDSRVRSVPFRVNAGKAAALQAGFDAATGDRIITMDADLQDDPAEIPALLAALDSGYDMVSGWKKERNDPLSKTVPSRLFNFVVRMLSGVRLHDFNCGLKAYRTDVVRSMRIYGELHRYIPVLAASRGFIVGEIPVRHHPRRFGRSKYGVKRYLAGFLDLLTVILLTRYTAKPLHFFGSIGIILCMLGGIVNLYIVSLWMQFHNIQGRQPLLVGGVFLVLLGVQFISTGLLAELITQGRMERLGAIVRNAEDDDRAVG